MTLQIGIVASDGFAIVGDTWKYVAAQGRSWFGYSGPKMLMSPSGKSLAAIARSVEISFKAAKEIFVQLEVHAGYRGDEISRIVSELAGDCDVELFLIFTDPRPEMYFLQKEKNGPPKCELMYGCYPIGDAGNSAYYWVMRYADANLAVEQFVRIGALTVLTGAKINPAMIRDLEIATYDRGQGLRIWERAETAAVRAEIDQLDARIGAALLNPGNAL